MSTEHTIPAMDDCLADEIAPERASFVEKGFWSDERLGASVTAHAAERPDAEAVVDRKSLRRITFRELDKLSNRMANWFADAGITEGDVIAMQLPNCLEAVVVTIGANKAGVAVNPM
jgi:non-ribosomal peptide synthetase component E (peptide arylation enzyme)